MNTKDQEINLIKTAQGAYAKQKLSSKTKVMLGSAGALAFLTLSSIGSVTFAATTNTTSSAFLDRVAQITGLDASKLKSALTQVATEDIDKKLASGEITQEQATKMKEAMAEGDFFYGPHNGPRGEMGGMMRLDIDGLATFFGLTPDQLREKGHTNGQTLLQIAQAQGKTEAELKAYLIEQFDNNLADAVTKGTVTEEKAAKLKTDRDTIITRMISETHKGGPREDKPSAQ